MQRRLKLLTGLSSIAFSGALALSACAGGEGEGTSAKAEDERAAHHGAEEGSEAAPALIASGGESEGAALVDVAHDKAAFYSALEIVRGHLLAGVELYNAGDRAMGSQHLRHPQAEIMTLLAPVFKASGAMNIDPALDALASASERGAPPAEIAELYSAALSAISFASMANEPTLKDQLLGVSKSLQTAGDEYTIGVVDGAISNLHEYHDSYGFIATALQDLEVMHGASREENDAIKLAIEQVKIAASAAPDVAPPVKGLKPASVIYGAAARIEIIARGL
ncbi:MAG: hypothetical protein AAB227_09300 [Pseudomonadota bacterium]